MENVSVVTSQEEKTINMVNRILVDGVVIMGKQYNISTTNPQKVNPSVFYIDNGEEIYKQHRFEIRPLETAFEEKVYVEQDRLIKELENNNGAI